MVKDLYGRDGNTRVPV